MAFDFPNSPAIGQVANGYVWDGEKWVQTAVVPNTSGVIAIKVFNASGTYVPSPNMTTCVIECVGGGGSGGGASSGAAGFSFGGGGGGAGGYSRKYATAAMIGASQVVTIGPAGAPGAAGASGQAGGPTSVGSLCLAYGGAGGNMSSGNVMGTGGTGAPLGVGDVTATGAPGGYGPWTTGNNTVWGGPGGSSYFGGAAIGGNNANGADATSHGGGGGGASQQNAIVQRPGGWGYNGIVVITEYGMTALTGTATGAVRYDLPQGLTTNQKGQARANIDVAKKNYIINGAMQVSQENGTTAGTTFSFYPVDQFVEEGSATAITFSIAQVASPTPRGSPNRIRITQGASVVASPAAGDLLGIIQRLEGLRVADLRFGSAAAKQITIQFGCKAPAGTYSVALTNGASNRSYPAEYVISAGEADTDVVKSVTISGDVTGAWAADNTTGMRVCFALMAGANFKSAPNAWAAVNAIASTNQFNFAATNGNVFELFDVSLTEGSVAPPFQVPDYASELALCQRYYHSRTAVMAGYNTAGGAVASWFPHPVPMRATPSVSVGGGGSATNATALAADTATVFGMRNVMNITATGLGQISGYAQFANARL